jgi:molybdopterin synthase catalytic subunit
MRIQVLPFGLLKDWLAASAVVIELPEGATVADLLARLSESRPAGLLRGIAVSVNAEYATAACRLHEGDEVGLLPPVSGGSDKTEGTAPSPAGSSATASSAARSSAAGPAESGSLPVESVLAPVVVTELTREPIDAQKLIAAAKRGDDGALVVFDGIVRNQTRGRQTLFLDYEAYEEMAVKQLDGLAREACSRFGVRQVTMVHRLGRLEICETSILIVVASAHRAAAFEACRWLIDTIKKTVPVWKKETFQDGAVWADGEPFPAELAVDAAGAAHSS